MNKIGIIGVGNMGYAMLKGAIKSFDIESIGYTDISKERLISIRNEINIPYCKDNKSCVLQSKYIIMAIKPQYYESLIKEIKNDLTTEHIIISIAPGITIETLKELTGNEIKVVRAMPNTPALVMEGMSAICFSADNYAEEEINTIMSFFNSFGQVIKIPEKFMDAIVPVLGSSPAYVYMFIEAIADAGVLFGLPRESAYKLAAQTVLGSAKMVLETGQHPGALKDAVCSPGGTTIEAVSELERNGFRSAVIEAMRVCYNKTKSMYKQS